MASAKERGEMQGPDCSQQACPSTSSPPYASQTLEALQLCPQPWPALTHRNKAKAGSVGKGFLPPFGTASLHPEILM